MNLDLFTDRAKGFLQSAQTVAIRMSHQRIAPEHLLKALLEGGQPDGDYLGHVELGPSAGHEGANCVGHFGVCVGDQRAQVFGVDAAAVFVGDPGDL